VVNGEKFECGLATASAPATVSNKHIEAKALVADA
jgi:hypothetical protein